MDFQLQNIYKLNGSTPEAAKVLIIRDVAELDKFVE